MNAAVAASVNTSSRGVCVRNAAMAVCQHQRPRSKCRDCGGGSFWQHQRLRYLCLECGGISLCRLQKPKWSCRACNVCKVPHHEARGRWLRHCWECGKEDLKVCDHNRYILRCPQCKRGGLTSSTGRRGLVRDVRGRKIDVGVGVVGGSVIGVQGTNRQSSTPPPPHHPHPHPHPYTPTHPPN